MQPAFALAVASLVSMEVAAEPIVAINGLSSTFPPANNDPQPRNLRPLAFGSFLSPPVFTLTRGDGSVVTAAHDVVDAELTGERGSTFVVPLPLLDAGEAVALDATCDGCAPHTLTWVVGDDVDDEAPAFGEGSGRFTFVTTVGRYGGLGPTGFEVELCVPAPRGTEPVILQISGDELPTPQLSFTSGTCNEGAGLFSGFVIDGGQPRDVCVDVVAIDAAGNESAPLTVCGAVEASEGGCAAAPTSTVGLAGLLLLLVRRRQR